MTIAEQKKKVRRQMLAERAKLEMPMKEKYDHWVCEEIWSIILEHKHQFVHSYLPMGAEINIYPLIERMLKAGITVVTPKTLPKPRMQHLVMSSLDELEAGVFGTRHPANAPVFTGKYDLIIVPGLAFDHLNFRLGYGGGYYDNFLVYHPETYKLGICYPFQRMETIPLESHDVELEEILCKD
ncbi:MAG: 5-formyltetrahydrofolate cyclo-ligase [Bacteroidetes bacterium]|nr:5-formyltetrahydrofolate cyclo-ligase [Bacteroidota bacterium]